MRKSITQYQYRCNTATTNRSLPCIVCRISRRHTVSASRTSTAYRLKMDFFLIFLGTNETKLHLKARLLSSPVVAPERRPKRARRCMMRDRKRCSHGREKHACADCNPCPRGKRKRDCVTCNPCPHGKRKRACAECNPCPHGKVKQDCTDCNPCPHGKLTRFCTDCTPCPHGKVKYSCADCNPCPHGKVKTDCTVCTPCPHGKLKHRCAGCKSARAG